MSANPLRVLLVDGRSLTADSVRQDLAAGPGPPPAVAQARSLREASEWLRREAADVVLLDLPDSHGLGTFDRIREAAPDAAIVVLSRFDDEAAALDAVRRGAQDYLVEGEVSGRMLRRILRYAVERKRAEKELREAKRAAEAASRSKTAFLANMSHEIRTPMNAVLGFAELLEARLKDDPGGAAELQAIQSAGRHLLGVINDILDLSKAESGEIQLERVPCSPLEIADDVLSTFRLDAEGKGLALSRTCRTPVPARILSDPTRLRQVLINLVGNAVKFTPAGAVSVELGVAPAPGSGRRLELSVRDTGVGIPRERLSEIFEPFVQVDAATTRRFGGTGLGLAISRRLARQMGGDLTVESEPGRGSVFTYSLRCEAAGDAEPAAAAGAAEPPAAAGAVAAAPPAPALPAGSRILVVEDVAVNRKLVRAILERAGCAVALAENGREAVDLCRTESFELVLMDIQMPVMDGFVALAQLRASGFSTPVVALTAHAMSGDREACFAAGFDDYVSKPVRGAALLEVVAWHLARASGGQGPRAGP